MSVWPGLGDIMFATPAIRHIRAAEPDAFIAAACFDDSPGASLLETNPYLDEVFFSPGTIHSARGLRSSIGWLRERRFDAALELSFSVYWLFRLAGIRDRARFAERGLSWVYPYADLSDRDVHAAEQFLRAAESLCGPFDRDGLSYDLVLTGEDRRVVDRMLKEVPRPFVIFHPGARCNRNKRWEVEKFVQLGRDLRDEKGVTIVVVGGAEDVPLADLIRARLGDRVVSFAGRASLRHTAAMCESAELYVGNDSGPLHVAASTGVPIVAIFASSNPANFAPPGDNVTVVTPEDECAPCLHFPGYNWLPWGLRLRYYNRCKAMEGLGVEPVRHACLALIDGVR